MYKEKRLLVLGELFSGLGSVKDIFLHILAATNLPGKLSAYIMAWQLKNKEKKYK